MSIQETNEKSSTSEYGRNLTDIILYFGFYADSVYL